MGALEEAQDFSDGWPRFERRQALLLVPSIGCTDVFFPWICNWQMIHGLVDSSDFREFYPNPVTLLCNPDLEEIQYFSL